MTGKIAAVILAGGASRRFGGAKLLHPWGESTLLEASLQAPLQASLGEVLVVTGAYHDALVPLLARYPVQVVHNPNWEEGLSSSIRAGLQALSAQSQRAALICLGDQPLLPAHVLIAMATRYREGEALIVAPSVDGVRCNPVLFDRSLFAELCAIRGDEGGRSLIQNRRAQVELVEFDDRSWFCDIDSPSDLAP